MASNNNFSFNILMTQTQKLSFFQEEIVPSYIAPKRNKNIIGVMTCNGDHNIIYGPTYAYGTDNIPEVDQIVIIHDDTPSTDNDLYWENLQNS